MNDTSVTFVAYGKILSINNMRNAWVNNVPVEYSFEINKFWKGEFYSSTVLLYDVLPCISDFEQSQSYLVFGQIRADSLIIWGSSDQQAKVEYISSNYPELEIETDYTSYYFAAAALFLIICIIILRKYDLFVNR